MAQHYSVLLAESLELLKIQPAGTYLDCTAGMGGHTRAIASAAIGSGNGDRVGSRSAIARHGAGEHGGVLGSDRISTCGVFGTEQFRAERHAGGSRCEQIPLTDPERGFSFMSDGPLDMRLDQTRGITAADLVNHSAEKQLTDWLYQLGEERRARKITGALIRGRPVRSTRHLADIVERAVPRSGPIHPATRTFMALRMVVNQEMEELDALLERAPRMVRPGGRIVIISFHSWKTGKSRIRSRTGADRQGRFTDEKACCPQ